MADSDRVELTDLDVFSRYSLAVRSATADRAELIATLRADLDWLSQPRPRSSGRAARVADVPDVDVADEPEIDAGEPDEESDGDEELANVPVATPVTAPARKQARPARAAARRAPAKRAAPPRAAAKKAATTKSTSTRKPAGKKAAVTKSTSARGAAARTTAKKTTAKKTSASKARKTARGRR